jgi:Holliday junction DNA helicase RuvA
MIAHLNGSVAAMEANSVVLDVNGVGYRAFVPSSLLATLPVIGGKAILHTVMVVREDDISLYGFASPEERHVFQTLTSVTGVGPKVGLAMLSVYDFSELSRAISQSDVKALTKIPGVGPKLAQRVCLELGERMAEFAFERRVDALAAGQTPEQNAAYEDIVEALVNWGYSRSDSKKSAERAISNATDKSNTPELIRVALNLLTGGSR